jgi:hypothetical protein
VRRRLIGFCFVAACASAGAPPGGPERHVPPEIVSISVDSEATNVKVKSVEFKFDEVVSDRPAGVTTGLDQIFLISPRNGNTEVSWHRTHVEVRPRKGFRPNTAYRITMLPGLVDLRGNARKDTRTLLFSTGPTFPPFSILGRVFDWAAERPASAAYVEAVSHPDTSIVYLTASDTTGQFELGPLPAGEYTIRALIDQNSNHVLDRNEKWDSVTKTISVTSPHVELDAIERDSMPPFFENVTVIDSVTLRAAFDKALDPRLPLQPALVRIQRADSSQLEVAGVQWAAAFDLARQAAQAKADSVAKRAADTTRAAPRPTPPAVPVPTPGSPRPPPPPPKPASPPPDKAIIIKLSPTTPFVLEQSYRITAKGMRNLVGNARDVTRPFTVPKPAPKPIPKPATDTTKRAPTDTTKPPPAKPPVPPRPPR